MAIKSIQSDLDKFFQTVNADAASAKALGEDVPLLGSGLKNVVAAPLDLFHDVQAKIDAALAAAPSGSAQDIAAALNGAGITGLTATVGPDDQQVAIAFDGKASLALGKAGVAIDVGNAALGLTATADFSGALTSSLAVRFNYDATTQKLAYADNGDHELQLDLDASAAVSGSGDLGPLGIAITDKRTDPEVALGFAIDLDGLDTPPGGVAATGSVNLDLGIATTLPSDLLPSLTADIDLAFKAGDAAPSLGLDNVEVDLGKLVDKLTATIKPILKIFGQAPFKQIIEGLIGPIPIINDAAQAISFLLDALDTVPDGGDKLVSFLDLAAVYYKSQGDTGAVATIQAFGDALVTIQQFAKLGAAGDLGKVALGSFSLSAAGASYTAPAVDPLAAADLGVKKAAPMAEGFKAQAQTAEGPLDDGFEGVSGLAVPILTDTRNVIESILLPGFALPGPADPYAPGGGKPATLISYTIPELSFTGTVGPYFFPIVGPIGLTLGGQFGGGVEFTIGYDTTAITSADHDPLEGIFISTPLSTSGSVPAQIRLDGNANLPFAYAFGEVDAGAGIDLGIVRADVNGGILGTAEAFLNNGEVHATDLDDCIFTLEGRLAAEVNVEFTIGYGFFSYTKRINIADITIADFSNGCDGGAPDAGGGLASPSGTENGIVLNVGSRAGDRSINGNKGKDGNETIRITKAVDEDGKPIADTLNLNGFGVDDPHGAPGQPVGLITGDFGKGNDTLVIAADVTQAAVIHGGGDNDVLVGGAGDDALYGDDGDDTLNGGSGTNLLVGGKGNDVFIAGSGVDTIYGGDQDRGGTGGTDQVDYSKSGAAVRFKEQSDGSFLGSGGDAQGDRLYDINYIVGSGFNDRLFAAAKRDTTLEGGAGNDALVGGAGNDYLIGGAGADSIQGGGGENGTSYITSNAGVDIDLANGFAAGGDATGDKLSQIQDVQGSAFDDLLLGDGSANRIDGSYGDDIIDGRGGGDIITGGDGDDTIFGGADGDTLQGGNGTDLLTYIDATKGVTVNLAKAKGGGGDRIGLVDAKGKFTAYETYSSFENLDGSAFGDSLTGDNGDNVIHGYGGDDFIDGGSGNDTLFGGVGADQLVGGAGIDTADYGDGFGVTVSLVAGVVGVGSTAAGDRLSGIENLSGSNGVDALTGDDGDNVIDPRFSGSATAVDQVAGGGGTDTIRIDASNGDRGIGLNGGFALGSADAGTFKRIDPGAAQSRNGHVISDPAASDINAAFSEIERLNVIGTAGADTIYGGTNSDTILTGDGDDTIYTGTGVDVVEAGGDDDTVFVGTDADRQLIRPLATGTDTAANLPFYIDGGSGVDTLSISTAAYTSDVILTGGTPGIEAPGIVNFADVGTGSAVVGFEQIADVVTGVGNDSVTQLGDIDNRISTGFGQDTITPGLGDDTIDGGYDFQVGNGILPPYQADGGGEFYQITPGGSHSPAILQNHGDTLKLDYSTYAGAGGVVGTTTQRRSDFNLVDNNARAIPVYTNDGVYTVGTGQPGASTDTFTEIERLIVTGTNASDTLTGTADGFYDLSPYGYDAEANTRGDDVLTGLGGDDTLVGLTGDDTLDGGAGNDTLIGSVVDPRHANDYLPPTEIDTLTGGAGADTFVLGTVRGSFYERDIARTSLTGSSHAIITDFTPIDGDKLQLYGQASEYTQVQQKVGDRTDTLIYRTEPDLTRVNPPLLVADLLDTASIDFNADYITYVGGPIALPKAAAILVNQTSAAPNVSSSAEVGPTMSVGGVAAPPAVESSAASVPVIKAAATPAFTVTQDSDPADLYDALFPGAGAGDGIDHTSDTITLSGNAAAFGTFKDDPTGLGSGIVLSTGRVVDLPGVNAKDGGYFPGTNKALAFTKIGRLGSTDIYRAELTGFASQISSLVINDSDSRTGGADGAASGFDLDAVALSRTKLDAADLTGKTLAQFDGALPKIDAFDFTAKGLQFKPGTEREYEPAQYAPGDPIGTANGIVDNAKARLQSFDADGVGLGSATLGDGGSLGLDLKAPVDAEQPLYLYVGEAGASGETLAGDIVASDRGLASTSDLSTDLGAPGPSGDTTTLTYTFKTQPGANVDTAFFDFALFSEELSEYAGSAFNDDFKVSLNGVNLALLSDGASATVNNLEQSPFGPTDPSLVLNPVGTGPAASVIKADSYTKPLTFAGALNPNGGTNTLVIQTSDVRDGLLDSGILIKGGTFKAGLGQGGITVGTPPPVAVGAPPTSVAVTLTGGAPTAPVTFTFTPDPDLDLGAGAGKPTTFTVNPGDPTSFTLPISSPPTGIPESGDTGVVDVSVASTDPRFGGQGVAPIIVSILADTAPTGVPTGLSLDPASDSGTKGDGITNVAAVKVDGMAEPNSTIALFDGTTLLGTATATPSGAFQVTGTPLADGTHDLTTVETNQAGLKGPASVALPVVIDTTAPAVPAAPKLAHDTGSSATDDVTSDPTLVFATPATGDVLLYSIDGKTYATTAPNLTADGTYTVLTEEQDAAGNTSGPSSLTFTLDTKPIAVTSIGVGGPGIDQNGNGTVGPGTTVTITVTTSEPVVVTPGSGGSVPTIALNDGGTATYVSGSGTATLSFTYTVLPGQSTPALAVSGLTGNGATATDAAGNPIDLASLTSARRPTGTLRVDMASAPPVSPVISGTHASSDTAEATVTPFSGVTIADGNAGATDSLTIILTGGGGTLVSPDGVLIRNADGSYSLTPGDPASLSRELTALRFTPVSGTQGATTTAFELRAMSSAGTEASDSRTVVTDIPAPVDSITVDQTITYNGDGTFTLTGTVFSRVGVRGVEFTANIDGQPDQPLDLGAATLNPDGTFAFTDKVGSQLQGFITATMTDKAGVQTQAAFRPALQADDLPRADRYSVTSTEVTYTGSTFFNPDGSHRVTVRAAGQTLNAAYHDTFNNHGAPETTFVFDPGYEHDTIRLFRVDNTDHDTLSFKGSDFGSDPAGQLASVLSHTFETKAGNAVIYDPVSHDRVTLVGISKQQLVANQQDMTFHT